MEAILLTHTHFDHIAGVDEVRNLKKCPVYVHALEADWLSDPLLNGSARWPEVGGEVSSGQRITSSAKKGELELLGRKFRVPAYARPFSGQRQLFVSIASVQRGCVVPAIGWTHGSSGGKQQRTVRIDSGQAALFAAGDDRLSRSRSGDDTGAGEAGQPLFVNFFNFGLTFPPKYGTL